jgi:hypothetical protein
MFVFCHDAVLQPAQQQLGSRGGQVWVCSLSPLSSFCSAQSLNWMNFYNIQPSQRVAGYFALSELPERCVVWVASTLLRYMALYMHGSGSFTVKSRVFIAASTLGSGSFTVKSRVFIAASTLVGDLQTSATRAPMHTLFVMLSPPPRHLAGLLRHAWNQSVACARGAQNGVHVTYVWGAGDRL